MDGILALRDNAFKAEFGDMGEDGRAVAFHVFIEPDAGAGLRQTRAWPCGPLADHAVGHRRSAR